MGVGAPVGPAGSGGVVYNPDAGPVGQVGNPNTPPPAAPGDSFGIGGGSTPANPGDPSLVSGSRGSGRPQGPRADGQGGAQTFIALQPGDTWESAVARRYGAAPPGLVAAIARHNGTASTATAPQERTLVTPSGQDLYFEMNPRVASHPPPALRSANFVAVAPGDYLEGVVRAQFPDAPANVVPLLGQLLATLNGHTGGESPGAMVAIPDARSMGQALSGLRNMQAERVDCGPTPMHRDMAMLQQFHGSLENPTDAPTAGQAYRPRWDDNLRGVVLRAYAAQLTAAGLSPDAAARKAEDYMLVVGLLNDISSSSAVPRYDSIWLPDVATVDTILHMGAGQSLEDARASGQPLMRSIRGRGDGIQEEATAFQALPHDPPAPARTPRDMLGAIDEASSYVTGLRIDNVYETSAGVTGIAMGFSLVVAMVNEFSFDTPSVGPGERAPMLDAETGSAYLDSTMPQLAADERGVRLGQASSLASARTRLVGLMDDQGDIHVRMQPGETWAQAVNRTVAGLQLGPEEAARTERVLARLGGEAPHGDVAISEARFNGGYFADYDIHEAPPSRSADRGVQAMRRCCGRAVNVTLPTTELEAETKEKESLEDSMPAQAYHALMQELRRDRVDPRSLSLAQVTQLKRDVQRAIARLAAQQLDTTQYVERLREEMQQISHQLAATN